MGRMQAGLSLMDGWVVNELPCVDGIVGILQRCRKEKDVAHAIHLHHHLRNNGLEIHRALGNYMVPMLVECGSVGDALHVFTRLVHRSEHSWTSLMLGHARRGEAQHAFRLYEAMKEDGVPPSKYTLMALLKASAQLKDVARGGEIYAEIVSRGLDTDAFVVNALVDMYAKCGSLAAAQKAFDEIILPDVVSWSVLIAGYAEHGFGQEALRCFEQMQLHGVSPDLVTFICALKACGCTRAIHKGREIHMQVMHKGVDTDLFVSSALLDMYAKCGALVEAHEVFDKLPIKDVVSWTALIAGYAEHGPAQEALNCFEQMQMEGISPDLVTLSCILKACGSIGAINKGREIHAEIGQKGLERDLLVGNAIISMYTKCGSLSEAWEVFQKLPVHDVVSWNTLIAGYAEYGFTQEALQCFEKMQLHGISPDVASWNALITGYTGHGFYQKAFAFFEKMQLEGVSPDPVTYACILKVCSSMGAVGKGQEVHADIICKGLEGDSFIITTLIDMYAKCGLVWKAKEVFDKLPVRSVVSWNAMINGYGTNYESRIAIRCCKEMVEHGVKPNAITFTCLLTACSQGSLVVEGCEYFKLMREEYGIVPTTDHFTCMVDLLARSGHLYDAEQFCKTLYHSSSDMWIALLTACKTYGDAELGLRCFKQLVHKIPENSTPYVLMASIYSIAGKSIDAYELEELRKLAGAIKKPASVFIEVKEEVHEFVVGDNQSKEVSAMIEILNSCIKGEGHVPKLDQVLRPVSDQEKDMALCEHAEKIALAFGLLNTPHGQTLRVTKNMRMCNNCHNANKIISRIEKREIVVRDSYSVHHFKDGKCSCRTVF